MQYRAIFYSFKKIDGLMVCSPRWKKYATSIRKIYTFTFIYAKKKYSKVNKIKKIKKNLMLFLWVL